MHALKHLIAILLGMVALSFISMAGQSSDTGGVETAHNWTEDEIGDESSGTSGGGSALTKSNDKGKLKWKSCSGKKTGRHQHDPHETITFSGGASGSAHGTGSKTTVSVSGGGEVEVGKPDGSGSGDADGSTVCIDGNKSKINVNGEGVTINFNDKPHDNTVNAKGSGTINLNGAPGDNVINTTGTWTIHP